MVSHFHLSYFYKAILLMLLLLLVGCQFTKKHSLEKLQKIQEEDVLAFVVHKDNPTESMTKYQLASLYLAKEQYWEDGNTPVKCIDLPQNSPERLALYSTVVKKDPSSVQRYWIKSIERGYPRRKPIIIASNKRILNMIHRDKNAIAYINLADYRAIESLKHLKVKVLQIDTVPPSVENARSGKYPFVMIE